MNRLQPLAFGLTVCAGVRCACALLVCLGYGASLRGAETAEEDPRTNPFGCLDAAMKLGDKLRLADLRAVVASKQEHLASIEAAAGRPPAELAGSYLFLAELMKRTGDYGALDYYRKAILAAPDEPAYDLFMADYLRLFRGVGHPQFPQAEYHYWETRRKLRQRRAPAKWDQGTREQLQRKLVTLYQEDGVPLTGPPAGDDSPVYPFQPRLFFSTVNSYADAATTLPLVDDVRALTAAAMLTEVRLMQGLSPDQLRSYIRDEPQFLTVDRFRLRYEDAPVLDVFYSYNTIGRGQLENYDQPGVFNTVTVDQVGAAVSGPAMVAQSFDLYWRAAYECVDRVGLVEWEPFQNEHINQYEASLAVSRFVGPDKLSIEGVSVYQDIHDVDIPGRDRTIVGGTVRYQMFRSLGCGSEALGNQYDRQFQLRGIEFFGGTLWDREAWGPVGVLHHDYFAGIAVRGFRIPALEPAFQSFDLLVQSTVFDSGVNDGTDQNNTQYRTSINLLGRLVDEEKQPVFIPTTGGTAHLAFLQLVVPFKHDLALNGLDQYENVTVGLQLQAKWYDTSMFGSTWLGSAGYTYENFYQLGKALHLFALNIGLGY
jgi:hypothetical protein